MHHRRLAVGRLAVGRLAVGRLAVGRLAVGRLVVGRLVVGRPVARCELLRGSAQCAAGVATGLYAGRWAS